MFSKFLRVSRRLAEEFDARQPENLAAQTAEQFSGGGPAEQSARNENGEAPREGQVTEFFQSIRRPAQQFGARSER